MRKLKLTPLFLLASVFGLSACTLPSWLSFLSFIPGLEAPEKEEKKEEKKEEEEEEEEEETYSAEKVCEDFNAALEADGWPFGAEWDDDYEEYSFGAAFGAEDDDGNPYDESEECLKSVVDYVGSYLPEYLVYQWQVVYLVQNIVVNLKKE